MNKGIFDLRERSLKTTISPSIDILNPSNIERLLFLLLEEGKIIKELYSKLDKEKYFILPNDILTQIKENFISEYSEENEQKEKIKEIYLKYNYLIDPHTAVAFAILPKINEKINKNNSLVISSTADFGKFPEVVYESILNEKCPNDLNFLYAELKEKFKNSENLFHPGLEGIYKNESFERNLIKDDYEIIKKKIYEKISEWNLNEEK